MRCRCKKCPTYMVQAESEHLGCVCPECGYRCTDCLGTNTVVQKDQLSRLAFDPRFSPEALARALAGDPEGRHGIILAKNQIAKNYGVQTAETLWQAKKKCPGLILLPPHMDKYRAMSRRVNAIYLDYTDQVEAFSIDESWLDVTASRNLFGDGAAIADLLRRRVREELGITISVGVSWNKTFAKMGSDYKKPDATTVITRENVSQILYPLPVTDLIFVGKSSGQVLARHGIHTIGDLAACSMTEAEAWLGKGGKGLWLAARGLDDSPVRCYGEHEAVKSVGNGMTYPQDLVGREACIAGLTPLCESVGARLRAQHLKCRTITLQIKDPQLKVISRQKPVDPPTNLTRYLLREVIQLLESAWPEGAPVRLFTVTAGSLMDESAPVTAQLSFLEEAPREDPRQRRLEQALDGLRNRFGQDAIATARGLTAPAMHRAGESSLEKTPESP